jgi:segregation and condensation protein B
VLLIAGEPISARKISQFASLADATEARTLIRRLNQFYDDGGCAFRVEEVAGGYQLLSRRKFGGWLRRLHQSPLETRLSSPALETLAVVAYRQPVTRGAVESIRGVQCGEMLRQLMERDLLKIVGRSNELGRPFLYGTTKRFLQIFGLRDLDDLPRARELSTPASASTRAPDNHSSGHGRPDEPVSLRDFQEETSVSMVIPQEQVEAEGDELLRLLASREIIAVEDDEDEDDFEDDDDADDEEDDEEAEDEEEDEDFDDDFDDEDWEEVDDEDEEWDEDEDEDDLDDDDDDEEEEDWEEEDDE